MSGNAEILNPKIEDGDYHIHTTRSDGKLSPEELLAVAHSLGYSQLTVTDHSEILYERYGSHPKVGWSKRESVEDIWLPDSYKDMRVQWGVEADVVSEDGKICNTISNIDTTFTVLSFHPFLYQPLTNLGPCTFEKAYINAIDKHADEIDVLGHPTMSAFANHVNIANIVDCANANSIPMEIDGTYVKHNHMNWAALEYMVANANQLMINSDGHAKADVRNARVYAIAYLNSKGYELEFPDSLTPRERSIMERLAFPASDN